MPINFPNNPTVQVPTNEFSPTSTPLSTENGVTYMWDGEKWVASASVLTGDYVKIIGDNMTGNLTLGTDKIELNATNGSITATGTLDVSTTDLPHSFYRLSGNPAAAAVSIKGGIDKNEVITLNGDGNITTVGDVKIGGTLPAAPNITLNADGGADFKGNVIVGDSYLTPNGALLVSGTNHSFYSDLNAGTSRWGTTAQITGGSHNIALDARDGSARFVGDLQSISQNGGQLAGFRNLLINGDFRIWQRDTAFEIVSSARFTADRWRTGADRGVDRVAFYNKYGAKCTVLPTVRPLIGQPIEIDVPGRPGPFVEGQQYTFSCVVKNAAAADIALSIEHRIASGDNTGAQGIVPVTVIGSDVLGPETLSFTFTYTSAMRPSADKTCTYVEISADDRTSEMTITNIQLEPGPVATPFEHRPIGTELALCQRYYQTSGTISGYVMARPGGVTGIASAYAEYRFPVQMRTAPSFSTSGTFNDSAGYSGTPRSSNISSSNLRLDSAIEVAPDTILFLQSVYDGVLHFDAEL